MSRGTILEVVGKHSGIEQVAKIYGKFTIFNVTHGDRRSQEGGRHNATGMHRRLDMERENHLMIMV